MPGNVFAGDALGAYLLSSADWAGTDLTEAGGPDLNAGSVRSKWYASCSPSTI